MTEIRLKAQPSTSIEPHWPLRRKIKVWLFMNLTPSVVYALWFCLNATLRWRSSVDPESEELIKTGKAAVFPFWHRDLFLATSISRLIGLHKRTVVMVGLSQAGEIETRLLKKFGYLVVRGSRKARAIDVMDDMLDAFEQGAVAGITVDGPSGPAGVVKPGVLMCARYGKVPIVPMGFQVSRKWSLKTWDSFIIPKPFARCIVSIGPPIREYGEAESLEVTAEHVATALNEQNDSKVSWDDCRFDKGFICE